MDKLKVQERFESAEINQKWPGWFRRLILWIEKDLYFKISKRINWLLDRIGNNSDFEIIKDGNVKGEDGNWRLKIDASGNLIIQENISGTWTDSGWKLDRSP